MGIGIVLLLWAVFGTIVASVGALIMGGATAFLIRRVTRWRRVTIIAACTFPFACFVWAAAVFAFQAVVNEGFLHRDPGLGDTWHCPIPNGYAVLMIDLTDEGWVYNPKTQGFPGGVGEQDDALANVQTMEISGQYILGARSAGHFEADSGQVRSYFLLDTAAGKYEIFPTYDRLRAAAAQRGIRVSLEPIYDVYARYRTTWFDKFALVLLVGPLLVAGALLALWILRLRKGRPITFWRALRSHRA